MTEQTADAVGPRLDAPVRPLVWARKDQLQHASTRGGLMCAMYPNTDRRADLQPLYDQAALDAAVEQANARQNAAWRLMCEKMVAAERERWRTAAAPALEWMEGAWHRIDGEWGPSGKTLDQECADGDEPVIAALRALLRA